MVAKKVAELMALERLLVRMAKVFAPLVHLFLQSS